MLKGNRTVARIGGVVAAAGAAAALVAGIDTVPANAASHIYITHSIRVPGLVRHQIDVHLNMSQADAAGYIYNGAKINLECFGDDLGDFFDHYLAGVPGGWGPDFTGSPKPGQPPGFGQLKATPTGVHLTTLNTYEKGRELNEDVWDDDEVYCEATWIDADGGKLKARSSVKEGWF